MMRWLARLAGVAVLASVPVHAQDLTGHAGPVSALSAGNGVLVSGGFDGRAIQWDPQGATARRIVRFHDGNVTALAVLADGFVSAGQDGRIALWRDGGEEPTFSTPRATSPISTLTANETEVVAGFFDGSLLRLDLATTTSIAQSAHDGRVSGVAFLPDGSLVSVGADLRFARWEPDGTLALRATLPELPNGMARAGAALAVVSADGALRLMSREGEVLPDRFLTDRPLVAVAASGVRVAASAIDGTVWLLDLPHLEVRAQIAASTGPVWALALTDDALFSAGADGVIRRWSAQDGSPVGQSETLAHETSTDTSRGAEVYRACAVCHSLVPGDHSRAGPSLHGVFGRRIATAEGYAFSEALTAMDIVWTPETVAELFTLGPHVYTPGSRMPDQRVTDADDRQALVEYIARQSE